MVVFVQKCLYSGRVVVFGKRVVVLGQNGRIRAKLLYLGKTGCIWAKCLFSAEVVVFGQNSSIWTKKGCIRVKVVVIGQKLL